MVNITFLNITKGLNETLQILNKTRSGPVTVANAPPIPPWLQDAVLTAYLVLLVLAVVLIAHYVYYARHAEARKDPPAPSTQGILSIIIPVKNEKVETVLSAVKRLTSIDCGEAEVLIVSDDPPPVYEQIKKAVEALGDPRVKVLNRPRPEGYKGTALNWAAEKARGEVLLLLDVDSIPPPDLCTRARAVGQREIAFLGWDGYAPVKTPIASLQLFLYKYMLYHIAILGRHATGHPIFALGSGIAVRKTFLKEIGGFCNCTADDYDISMKAYLNRGSVKYLPGPPVFVEVPAGYETFKRQYARWTYNSAYLLVEHGAKLFKLPAHLPHRLSMFFNVVTHPLMVLTTFATLLAGLAMGYMGIILPPLHILVLQIALGIAALLQVYYVYRIAKRDGLGFFTVAGRLAESATLLLSLSPYLTFYVFLGLFKRRIRWYVTPKGVAALVGKALGLYELGALAALTALLAYAVYAGNPVLAGNAAFLLAAFLYVYLRIAKPSSSS
ncbi:MAG: glycosyltransferase family 2 protein [Pyrobaculum sp.]